MIYMSGISRDGGNEMCLSPKQEHNHQHPHCLTSCPHHDSDPRGYSPVFLAFVVRGMMIIMLFLLPHFAVPMTSINLHLEISVIMCMP